MFPSIDWDEIFYGLKKSYRYVVAILFLKHLIFIKDLKKYKNKYLWAPNKYILFGLIILLFVSSLIDFLSSILIMTIILIQYNFYSLVS